MTVTSEDGVTQTIVASHDELLPGNCLQAAVATFFGRPLEQVPHFGLFNSWHEALNLWVKDWYDLGTRIRPVEKGYPSSSVGRYLLIGTSRRGFSHVTVAIGRDVVWDPHPSRLGLVGPKRTLVFYALGEIGERWLRESRPVQAWERSAGDVDQPADKETP